jgi:hypothetical protein
MLVLVLVTSTPPIAGRQHRRKAEASALALVGVSVITMEREEVLLNRTVIGENGTITAIGPETKAHVPDDAFLRWLP